MQFHQAWSFGAFTCITSPKDHLIELNLDLLQQLLPSGWGDCVLVLLCSLCSEETETTAAHRLPSSYGSYTRLQALLFNDSLCGFPVRVG